MSTSPDKLLGAVLLTDALSCAVMGVGLVAAAGPLATLAALPPALLSGAGIALLPIAAVIAAIASRGALRARLTPLVVIGNVAWIAASLAILGFGLVRPNAVGVALVLAQAGAVGVLTALEAALHRSDNVAVAR